MRQALALAAKSRGLTAPNPAVGAVLVHDGQVVASGRHEVCGGPHAEVACLADAARKGVDPAVCAMYVTLEPCNHHGRTPPCSQAVLAAGIQRLYVGCPDPNPDVTGGGADFLRAHGVQVHTGLLERECRDMIADFLVWKTTTRTYNPLKLAATLDGRIACRTGHSQWITGQAARRRVHELRARYDAVLVGGQTFRADNPGLDPRLSPAPAWAKNPLAVVLTSQLPDPATDCRLLRDRPTQTLFLTDSASAASETASRLRDIGVRVFSLGEPGRMSLVRAFTTLRAEAGCHTVLCEGGGRLGLSLLAAGLADEFLLFLAPKILGDELAVPLFSGRRAESMDQALGLRPTASERLGDDLLLTFRPKD
ncbi:bifunctional diaminohydroxyphosphoribosylaminopyrimidine deaminase/5-amino-6-(5-phosphoribosylamino)uracil reductase RibD [Desulfolutivibrio sulfoxidireducens]|uniref:bifunctional diaminohydroxyphosphoribosylaminopyrimidine deaminase/5-amino-6-(5-phosphoribosylamino)uracil reductase RibD n=1 Tax=Desulfolutivibrio sulfoxidireducens TaxID=2773299 RepID=UPI00159E8F58|nr:bifunctional diaminohydroxyphosphoribosylaminopyrimidine deaminase/5-amino-6-(5-phosphoribosylamino)uracil reductase RibD [Desulfolutivibrio sulfoxidireducens]QLA17994.1 bifunctional diaminohydroxyphosphoribosylaminopyrimidine deaminase/5-amino-6-(5-phosphoribosylamino)uracil reductase RibD [Desulfolutivibrio sulfoxidireducens]